MSTTQTVRYNNQKWLVDVASDTLSLQSDKKVKISIDEVWMSLSDRDQDLIADIQAAKNEREFDLDGEIKITDFDDEEID